MSNSAPLATTPQDYDLAPLRLAGTPDDAWASTCFVKPNIYEEVVSSTRSVAVMGEVGSGKTTLSQCLTFGEAAPPGAPLTNPLAVEYPLRHWPPNLPASLFRHDHVGGLFWAVAHHLQHYLQNEPAAFLRLRPSQLDFARWLFTHFLPQKFTLTAKQLEDHATDEVAEKMARWAKADYEDPYRPEDPVNLQLASLVSFARALGFAGIWLVVDCNPADFEECPWLLPNLDELLAAQALLEQEGISLKLFLPPQAEVTLHESWALKRGRIRRSVLTWTAGQREALVTQRLQFACAGLHPVQLFENARVYAEFTSTLAKDLLAEDNLRGWLRAWQLVLLFQQHTQVTPVRVTDWPHLQRELYIHLGKLRVDPSGTDNGETRVWRGQREVTALSPRQRAVLAHLWQRQQAVSPDDLYTKVISKFEKRTINDTKSSLYADIRRLRDILEPLASKKSGKKESPLYLSTDVGYCLELHPGRLSLLKPDW